MAQVGGCRRRAARRPRHRRPLGSAAVAVVAAAVAMVAFTPLAGSQVVPQEGQEGNGGKRPGTWRGTGGALGVRAYLNFEPRPLPVDDFLTLHLPDAVTSWDSTGDVRARASSVFPGQTVVGLPDLLATFGVPAINEVLPPYPATAFAGPTNPDVTSADGTSHARVGDNLAFIEAVGRAAAPAATEALATVVDAEALFARSRQEFNGGALVSRSESRMGSVRIAGNLVSVDGVHVTAEARAAETGEPQATTTVQVGNVAVAGTPVRVRDDGLEVGGMVIPPGGLPGTIRPSGVAGRVNDVVRAFNLRIRSLGSEREVEGRAGRARAGGLIVEAAIPVEGPALPVVPLPDAVNDVLSGRLPLPVPDIDPNVIYRTYLLSVVVGEASAESFADVGGAGELGDLATTVGDESILGGPGADGGQAASGPTGASLAEPEGPATSGTPGAGAPTPGGPGAAAGDGELVLLGALTARRVEVLAGFLTVATIVALGAMRFLTLPVRRRR